MVAASTGIPINNGPGFPLIAAGPISRLFRRSDLFIMDFGKVDNPSSVTFSLPPGHALNARIWSNVTSAKQPHVFIGGPVWANKDYVGKVYPSTAKERDFLHYYVRQFNTIELNLTHYQIPTPAMIDKWKTEAAGAVAEPGGRGTFLYCPKFPQAISHERLLQGAESITNEFINAIFGLEEFLGVSFLQLPPSFGPESWPILERYLSHLPDDLAVAVEFRHPDWFKPAAWGQTLERLHTLHRHTVITDVAGRRDVLHMGLSSPVLTLRFIANEGHASDYVRTDEWIQRLKLWFDKGLQTAYLFIHGGGDNDTAPELIRYWVRQLNEQCGLKLREPVLQPQVVQGSLF